MTKVFVYYNGSVDNFKKIANYETLYEKSIVFISGVNEEGAAIYTHGKFYANIKEVEDLATELADLKIIKGVKVGESIRTAADHDGIIEFTSDNDSTVSIVGTSTGIQIGLNSNFVKRVTDTESNITNVSNRVTAIEGTANDTSSVNSIPGVKKYAEEKASAAESAAKGYADGLVATGSALELRVNANEVAIEVLNGEGDGSVKKAVANGIAEVVAGAHADFDTLKEVADWIGSDTTGAAQMQTDIATLKADANTEGSVAKTVKDAKEEITNIITENERVVAEALTNLNTRTAELEGKNATINSALQASDITVGSDDGTISVKGSDIAVKGLGSAAYTEASAYATAAQGALAEAAAPQATTYNKTEVDAMWEWEEI